MINYELLKGFLIGCAFFGIGFLLGRIHRKIRKHRQFKKFLKKKHEEYLYEDYIRHKNSGIFKGSFEEYKERIKIGPFGSVGPS